MNGRKLQKIKSDIKQIAIPLIAISLYILLGNLIFGKICPTRMILGIPCPGCGTTRAFLLLMQGRISQATVSNPIWISIVVFGIVFLINRYFVTSKTVSDRITYILKKAVVIVSVLCIAYYVYRMIYWFPNREPMVYDPENILQRFGIINNK